MNAPKRPIAFILKGWPRLSETFIANEIHALERAGLNIRIYALRHPTDRDRHPVHDAIQAQASYLPEYLHDEPLRVLRAWWQARRLPGFQRAARAFRRDLMRDPTRNRVRRFGQAMVLATDLPAEIRHLHAHFLHTPASVTRYAAMIRGLSFSISAHAKDIWTTPAWDKREKLAESIFTVTCTGTGHRHLSDLSRNNGKVHLAYHGLDLSAVPEPPLTRPSRDGSDPSDPVRIVSIGRLVEKKGFDVLLDALAMLPPNLAWRFDHVGGGALASKLKRKSQTLGLQNRIVWHGALSHRDIFRVLQEGDLFVLPSRIAASGDRDGLPNVLMEAMSQKLPCISSAVAAIPELINTDDIGILVPPEDPAALSKALHHMIQNPALRDRMGAAGYRRVKSAFSPDAGQDLLQSLFAHALGGARE